jgi:hypothetical protein
MREPSILNSTNNIKKATSIPTKLFSNNNINGDDNVTPGEKKSEENNGDTNPNRRQLRKRMIPKDISVNLIRKIASVILNTKMET